MSMTIEIRHINKRFGGFHRALNDVTLEIPEGELVALLGPSGSGKTTPAAHHRRAGEGRQRAVFLEGVDLSNLHVREREVGFVFQHYALFRHMTVFENVAFGLRVKPRDQRPAKPRSASGERAAATGAARLPGRPLSRRSSPAASASASRSPAPWPSSPRCCCSTSRSARSTPRCARSCAAGCGRLHDEMHVTSVFVTHDQEEAPKWRDRVV